MANRRKPTSIHKLQGTFQNCRHGGVEPEFNYEAPEAPDILDGVALEEWNRVVPELADLGLLTVLDRACLTQYCLMWSELMQYSKDEPLTPAWHNQFKLVYQQLGFSVVSRAGLRLPEKKPDKPKSVFSGAM